MTGPLYDTQGNPMGQPAATHEFTEDVDDASMCICGIPALTHDAWMAPVRTKNPPDLNSIRTQQRNRQQAQKRRRRKATT